MQQPIPPTEVGRAASASALIHIDAVLAFNVETIVELYNCE